MNDELVRMWKVVSVYFKDLCPHLLGMTWDNHQLSQVSSS
jgi:hypothetical protein